MTYQLAQDDNGSPVLETARLRLRKPSASHLPGFTAYMSDERSRFTGGPADAQGAFRALASVIGHWELLGYGLFAITLRDGGQTIGLAGHLNPTDWPAPELAWNLWSADYEGKGYAYEAASAIRDYAFGPLGWAEAHSIIVPENTRSAALAKRLGATPAREIEFFGHKAVLWQHAKAAA